MAVRTEECNGCLVQGPLAHLSPAQMREVAAAIRDVLDLDEPDE